MTALRAQGRTKFLRSVIQTQVELLDSFPGCEGWGEGGRHGLTTGWTRKWGIVSYSVAAQRSSNSKLCDNAESVRWW